MQRSDLPVSHEGVNAASLCRGRPVGLEESAQSPLPIYRRLAEAAIGERSSRSLHYKPDPPVQRAGAGVPRRDWTVCRNTTSRSGSGIASMACMVTRIAQHASTEGTLDGLAEKAE